MIEIHQLSKRFGQAIAVDDLTVTVSPGRVTGFLGPNGAGKSTTLRMIVGLARPSAGTVLVNGRRYADIAAPLHEVGALLDARAVHPGRTAQDHLRMLAATAGIGNSRVWEVLELVGLSDVARQRVKAFSLGMTQRLGIASALLGDPGVVLLDEPVNGLDPDGIHWIRGLLRRLAAEGRTVFVSSHLMSEMALTADQLVVLGRGRLLADVAMPDLLDTAVPRTRVRTSQTADLVAALQSAGAQVEQPEASVLLVTGRTEEQVAELAFAHRILLHEVTPLHRSLEDAYLDLTQHARAHVSSPPSKHGESRRAA